MAHGFGRGKTAQRNGCQKAGAHLCGLLAAHKTFQQGVSPATGLIALTRTPCGASSIAMARVAVIIQPLEALYQFRLGAATHLR